MILYPPLEHNIMNYQLANNIIAFDENISLDGLDRELQQPALFYSYIYVNTINTLFHSLMYKLLMQLSRFCIPS